MAPKTVSVTVKYSKPGIQPPIYLAGSFSDPAWQPQEMLYKTNEANEHEFYKEVQVEEGHEYQYKFRVGEGDWWLLNEDSATVTDDAGNRNNVLSVPVSEDPAAAERSTSEHPEIAVKEEPTSDTVTEMDSTKPEASEGEKSAEEAPTHTKGKENIKEVEAPKEQSELPTKEEHTIITPAHTNTPAEVEIIVNEKEADAPSSGPDAIEIPEEAQHPNGHVELPSTEDTTASSKDEVDDNIKAQLVADSITQSHSSDAVHSEEEEKQPSELSLTPLLSEPVEPAPTPALQADQESSKALETISSPTLIVEKVDDELRHGDDFGSAATVGQRDAHLLRSEDALPDHVVMRAESRTPELADTAAEVSESAALLDRDPPTPPISDEEAGRIGYRRMSSTPIPQVAKTAAEVADVAATLEEGTPVIEAVEDRSGPKEDGEEDVLDSGASTPASQRAPKFAYECLGPDDTEPPAQPSNNQQIDPLEPVHSRYEEIDWNDPSIEMFPTERVEIINRLRRLSERLPEDVAEVDVVPPSPVVGSDGHPEQQLPALSPTFISHEVSPSLDSIAEENDEHQETLVSLTEISELVSTGEAPALSKGLDDSVVVVNGLEKREVAAVEKGVEPDFTASGDGGEAATKASEPTTEVPKPSSQTDDEAIKSLEKTEDAEIVEESGVPAFTESGDEDIAASASGPITEVEKPSSKTDDEDVKSLEATEGTEIAEASAKRDLSSITQDKDEKTPAEQPEELPSVEVPEGSSKPELTSSKEQTRDATGIAEESSVKIQEVAAETPPVDQTSNAEEVQEITTGSEGPNITIQPATPGISSSKTDFNIKPLDETKSTAIEEENGRSQVKARKQPRSQSPQRPATPNSLRSATKDGKSKNLLKAFWRVVFVDFFGGLVRALCGGGRGRYTLLAVGAIVLVALAPTLYSSFVGSSLNSLWG